MLTFTSNFCRQALPCLQKPRSGWFGWPSVAVGSNYRFVAASAALEGSTSRFVAASADLIPRDSPACSELPQRRSLRLEVLCRYAGFADTFGK